MDSDAKTCKMTLAEFQAGEGIAINSQIVLINNERTFAGLTPCYYPYRNFRVGKFLSECVNRRTLFHPRKFSKSSASKSNQLFAGYFDRSFDDLGFLDPVFNWMGSLPDRQFELVIGKGDYSIEKDFLLRVPDNVARVWANNVNVDDPRFRYLPMGRDFRSLSLFEKQKPNGQKTTTCYCNFSTSTHPIRQQVFEMLQDKSFIDFDHMGKFLQYSMSREEFFQKLSSAKFSVCPRGNAYDTFRMWDSLYLGTIPIVVKEARYQESLTDLPILFLDSYEQFATLSLDFLNEKYEQMLQQVFDYKKLTIDHWLPQSCRV